MSIQTTANGGLSWNERINHNRKADGIPDGIMTTEHKRMKDAEVGCPRCLEYNLPKYYIGALGYWYSVRNSGRPVLDVMYHYFVHLKNSRGLLNYLSYPLIEMVSNHDDELCSNCGDNEAGQARIEQSKMTIEELGMLRDWIIVSKEDTS